MHGASAILYNVHYLTKKNLIFQAFVPYLDLEFILYQKTSKALYDKQIFFKNDIEKHVGKNIININFPRIKNVYLKWCFTKESAYIEMLLF